MGAMDSFIYPITLHLHTLTYAILRSDWPITKGINYGIPLPVLKIYKFLLFN